MRESLEKISKKYIEKRDMINNVLKWSNSYIVAICAEMLAENETDVTAGKMTACQQILDSSTSIFSNFKGYVYLPVITMLAVSENPEEKMKKTKSIYEILKKHFYGSVYLSLVSTVLADMVEVEEVEKYAIRGRRIYELMKENHPFLTSADDSVVAVLMAFSEKSDAELVNDMETSYKLLKSKFSGGNNIQAVSHVLALTEGKQEEKCQRVFDMYDEFDRLDRKYGKYYELNVLGSLAMLDVDVKELVRDILLVDEFLEKQKGYGGFFGIDSKTRLMHAAMLVCSDYAKDSNMTTAAMTQTMVMVAAQQAALCAIMASTAAVNAAN